MENQGEIILYQPDNEVKLEVRLEEETVWLTQAQMAELFQTSKQNVSLHTNNIFKEKELSPDSVVKESLTTAADGKKYRVKYYNLDVIISVGYRVKSILQHTVPPMGEPCAEGIPAERLFRQPTPEQFGGSDEQQVSGARTTPESDRQQD